MTFRQLVCWFCVVVAFFLSWPQFVDAATCVSFGAGGNWNSSGSWELSDGSLGDGTSCDADGIPDSDDMAQVLSGDTITLNTDATIASTTIDSGGIFTEDGNSRTLTIAGQSNANANWTNSGTFTPNTSTVTFSSGGTITGGTTFKNLQFTPTAAAATMVISSGTYATTTGTLTLGGTQTLQVNTGNVDAQGDVTVTNNAAGNGGNATLTFNGSGAQTLTGSGTAGIGALPLIAIDKTSGTLTLMSIITVGLSNAGTNTPWNYVRGTVDATTNDSTVVFIKSGGTGTIDGQGASATMAFDNIMFRRTGGVSATFSLGGNLDVDGNLTINPNSTSVALNDNGKDINVAGNWTNNSTFTSSGTTTFDGSSDSTINTGGTGAGADFNNFTVTKTGSAVAKLVTNGLDVDGTLTITSGTLNLDGQNVSTVTTFVNNGTLKLRGSETVSWTTNDTDTGTYEYIGDSDSAQDTYTLLDFGATDYYNLTFTATTTENDIFRTNGGLKAAGSLTVGSSTLDISTNSNTATTTGTLTVSGGTLTATSGAIDADGSVVLSSGTITAPSGSFNIAGNWTKTGGTFTHSSGTVTFDGSATQAVSGATTWNNLTINNSAASPSDSADVDPDAAQTVAGTLTVTDGQWSAFTGDDYVNVSIGAAGILKPDSSSSITASGDWTTTGTFTHNSGTVTFDGSATQAITGATTWNNLTINNTAGTPSDTADVDPTAAQTVDGTLTVTDGQYSAVTADDYVNVSIGAAGILKPDSAAAVTVSGNWSNAGVFTSNSGTVTFDGSGAQTLTSGGTGTDNDFDTLRVNKGGNTLSLATNALDVDTLLRISGNTFSPGSLDTTAGALTVDGGTLTGGSGALDVNGVVTLSSGTLTAPSGTFTVSGGWAKSGGTFTSGGNTVTFDGTGDITLNAGGTDTGSDFDTLRVNKSSGTLSLLTNSLDVDTLLRVSSGIFSPGSLNTTAGALTIDGGTFTGSSGTADVNGAVTLSSGALTAPSGTFTVSGNWTNSGGTFSHNSGTVTLDGTNQTISGSNTFSGLTKTDPSNDSTDLTLTFDNTATQTIAGTLTLTGIDTDDRINLVSNSPGTRWEMAGTSYSVTWADVTDSDNSTGTAASHTNTVDGGNNLNWGFDSTAPTRSAGSPSGEQAADTTQVTMSLTTNESATCKYGTTASTAYASIANTFTTTGGTSHSQTISGLVNGNSYTYYVRCTDSSSNTNTDDFTISWSIASSSGGGGGSSFTQSGTNVPPPTPNLLDQAAVQLNSLLSGALRLLPRAGLPVPTERPELVIFPPLAPEELPAETPPAFAGNWQLLPDVSLQSFVLAPLPKDLLALSTKFPALRATFQSVGITRLSDFGRLRNSELNLPSLAEVGDLVPTDIVFARGAGNTLDYNLAIQIAESGQIEQKIRTIVGESMHLVVRPEADAESVVGYLVLKGKLNQPDQLSTSLWQKFVAAVALTDRAVPKQIEERMVLAKFEYQDIDGDGVYTADVAAPRVAGEYEIITIVDYESVDLGTKELRLLAVIDPEGYVFERVRGRELRISDATVSIYWLNPATGQFTLWPAEDFQQTNPQVTDNRGTYAFLVPEGRYYLTVTSSDYPAYKGKEFDVTSGSGVHMNIELKSRFGWLKNFGWIGGLLVLVLLLLAYNFYRDKMREHNG